MIRLDAVSKSFGDVRALGGISFEVPDGQVTGLLGPNGAGKTTALRIVYGVLRPDAGVASVDGIDLVDRPARRPAAARASSRTRRGSTRASPPASTSSTSARCTASPGRRCARRADELVAALGMEDIADRRTEGFSQGQRVKVALARSLVHDPRNVVLDEPTNGLDVAATRQVRTLLRQLREQGRCILFSSHVMQEVSALCDRVVVIARGAVVAEGTPDDLRRQTGKESLEDAFVAAIGSEEGLA